MATGVRSVAGAVARAWGVVKPGGGLAIVTAHGYLPEAFPHASLDMADIVLL